jgi:hypothetical protein
MTPLEDRVRHALAGKAREFPPDAVPPLRLPARPAEAGWCLGPPPSRWPP